MEERDKTRFRDESRALDILVENLKSAAHQIEVVYGS